MKRYRILKYANYYFIQKRGWFRWKDVGHSETSFRAKFKTKKEAKDYILKEIPTCDETVVEEFSI